jgi:hypothetical protein
MLGRRRIDTAAPIRSSLANAAFAVEERVVWGGADLLRRFFDAIKWPFEQAVWAIERSLVWPIEERTDGWGAPVRVFGVAALALLAVGAGVLGLVWASGSGGEGSQAQQASVPVAPVEPPVVKSTPSPAAPVLHGAKPDFSAESGGGVSKSAGEIASSGSPAKSAADAAESTTANSTSDIASSGANAVEPAGPAATIVAQQFAGAFVLYETGHRDRRVRFTFKATATPQLTNSLLRRPPRLPANAKVPQAEVLHVVPGPHRGETYTLSVSLLRVGVTSELRLSMQRSKKTGEWQVAKILG